MFYEVHAYERVARPGGFTTIELLIVMALIAILTGFAAPSLREIVMNARMSAQVNDLLADLATARAEAVKRNVRTYLCTSSNQSTCTTSGWAQGRLIFVDLNQNNQWDAGEPVIKATSALEAGNTLTVTGAVVQAGVAYIPYRPSGAALPGASIELRLCDIRTNAGAGRQITINATGRPVVSRVTCD